MHVVCIKRICMNRNKRIYTFLNGCVQKRDCMNLYTHLRVVNVVEYVDTFVLSQLYVYTTNIESHSEALSLMTRTYNQLQVTIDVNE